MKSSKAGFKRSRPLLGTYVSIELQGTASEGKMQDCITRGFEAVERIDRLMSYHRADSELMRLNRARAGVWVDISPETSAVLEFSNQLFLKSAGVFDIRCAASLVRSGLLPKVLRESSPIDSSVLPLEISGGRVRKNGGWLLDLGGVAKGYSVDYAVQAVKEHSGGEKISGIINAGGDLRVWGAVSIPVALRIHGNRDTARSLMLRRTAAATSSVQKFDLADGGRAVSAHIRMPSENPFEKKSTVTVLAPQCMHADALTKVVLMAKAKQIESCLSMCKAKALVFKADGLIDKVIG